MPLRSIPAPQDPITEPIAVKVGVTRLVPGAGMPWATVVRVAETAAGKVPVLSRLKYGVYVARAFEMGP